ncbi:MAG: hypothetical protein JWR60_4016 [Polaromonas sp.]|nr:hypothetical protein [Polaromonas sp.]
MPSPPTTHLLIPFAACSASAWLPTMEALPPHGLKHLGQLLQGMKLIETDTQSAESLSPPHERALARALGLAGPQTPDGLIPWAAHDAVQQLEQPASGKAWAWITPCHWAMGHLHATLSDPAALQLQESESRALLALMQPYFETDGLTLHYLDALGPGRWLAEGELFRQLPTASLDRVMARNVDAWLPQASAAPQDNSDGSAALHEAVRTASRTLRRLQNEMQMLLYTDAFNDARTTRGQLPVNSFWVSGTGALPAGYNPEAVAKAGISMPRSLAQAVFREDWPAYAQAWGVLEASEIAGLLVRQRAGETVRLSLCGESSARTFETQRASLWQRFSSLFSPLRIQDLLKQL